MIKKGFLNKDMKKVMLKLRILRMIGEKRTYSYAIVKKFSESKYASRFLGNKGAIKNEVYNTISALEKSGYIKKETKFKTAKNYYKITKEGKTMLKSTRKIFMASMKELAKIIR